MFKPRPSWGSVFSMSNRCAAIPCMVGTWAKMRNVLKAMLADVDEVYANGLKTIGNWYKSL